jgi:hypothetical protein
MMGMESDMVDVLWDRLSIHWGISKVLCPVVDS